MQGHGHPGRAETYEKALGAFAKGTRYRHENVERFEIPYRGRVIPVLLTRAHGVEGPAPAVVYLNGLDSCKELLFWSKLPQELARAASPPSRRPAGHRREPAPSGLPATWRSEEWGTPVYEWLAARDDIDADRIGITGISLGGFYAPRVVRSNRALPCGAVWGANHNWAEVQQKRLKREGENPVPHYWNHVQWVFGARTWTISSRKPRGCI